MFISCNNDGRKIKNLITAILKSGLATEIKKLNYIKSYTIQNNKVQKEEQKLLRINETKETEKIEVMIKKTLPEAKILK